MTETALSDAGLTAAEVESWTEDLQGTKFVCFKNKRGELFHFKKSKLMRGKVRAPYNTIEEFTRPATVLTCENAANVSHMSISVIRKDIELGKLKATKKIWRHGTHRRVGLLIDIADLEQWLAKKMIQKYKGKLIEWDIDPQRLIRQAAEG